MADKIHLRVTQLKAADSVETLIKGSVGRCHPLKGNLTGKFAMDLEQPYRLIFEEKESEIRLVEITNIVDYH